MDENTTYLSDNDEEIYDIELEDNLSEAKEQLDIREWKLKELETIIQHTEKNTKTRLSISIPIVVNFAKNLQYALSLSSIPVYNTIDDYIISLPLPEDNKDFNDAIAALRTQADQRSNESVEFICPIRNCTYKSTRLSNSKQHVIGRHYKLDRFECKVCRLPYKRYQCLIIHITNKHLNGVRIDQILCNVCQQTFCETAKKERHLLLGHVEQVGQSVFKSNTPCNIFMDVFKPDDVKKSNGFSYQIYVIPWVNDKNELYDISVGFTGFLEVTQTATKLWQKVERQCKNLFDDTHKPTRWKLDGVCGSARREYFAGNRMNPEASFSLELYAVSSVVAAQLKWFVRQYFDSIRIMATEESKFYLEQYNDWLKNHLAQFLPRLPLKTQKHVAEFGPSFGFKNLTN